MNMSKMYNKTVNIYNILITGELTILKLVM